jgi:hypothetical protein
MLNKYIYMENLHSMNVKLFYKVLLDNVVELLPILYTPTVGEACQKFGSIFRNFAGTVQDVSKTQYVAIIHCVTLCYLYVYNMLVQHLHYLEVNSLILTAQRTHYKPPQSTFVKSTF